MVRGLDVDILEFTQDTANVFNNLYMINGIAVKGVYNVHSYYTMNSFW
jgi:hypothetical protein